MQLSHLHCSTLRVILLEDLPGRGKAGEEVEVKRGFARNFLIPQKKAVYNTDKFKSMYQHLLDAAKKAEATAK